MAHAALRLLLQTAPAPPGPVPAAAAWPPPAEVDDIGTSQPDETIPSTAAIVAGVAGGLGLLTLCLAVALVFAVASIYGWRLVPGERSDGVQTKKGGSNVQALLDERRDPQLPAIVTGRLATVSSPPQGEAEDLASYDSIMSNVSAPSMARTSGGTTVSPLHSDASWRECLIEPDQIQVLLRRDGKPWVLGGGAFGQVYKALYDGVQVVAVKVLTGLRDDRMLQSFLHEASILRDMRDKNIVQFVGICVGSEEEGQPDEAMMVQEFAEAGDLFKALKWRDQAGRRVFGWYARGKSAACDIVRGLHYVHSRKIVHLDMKSSNVLLARDGTCKIADVGLARSLRTKNYISQAGTMGTFAWAAPEVLTGQQCSTSADIFSFGIILWELVTGEVPIRGQLRQVHVPEECPQEVVDLIDRCTTLDPKQRPSAKQIVQELEGALAGTPNTAEAHAAPLRAASLGPWRDLLPQQVSKISIEKASSAPLTDPSMIIEEETGLHTLSDDAEELAAAAALSEQQQQRPPPTLAPLPTLKLEDLPPLSDADKLF